MEVLRVLLVCLLLVTTCAARTIVVDDDARGDPGPNDSAVSDALEEGSSDHPFDSIQEAIEKAEDGDIVKVRPGAYVESINFYGKAITVSSIDPDDPAIVARTVIRRKGRFPNDTVRFDCGEDSRSVLSGFTIEAAGPAKNTGFGIYCHYSSPLISNMVIGYHMTGIQGEGASPVLVNNCISDNSRCGIEGLDGEITNCTIRKNGAYGLYDCDGPIVNCIISYNSGIGLYRCDGSVANCLVTGNGEGLQSCNGEVKNCTISYNTGGNGLQSCHGEIRNCVITSNVRYGLSNCQGSIKYNNVWGNVLGNYASGTVAGVRDIHADPLFAGPEDFHLKSKGGRWDEDLRGWVIDDVTSPSIDTGGDRCGPSAAEPAPNGDRVNQGTYGGTAEASKSPYGETLYAAGEIAGEGRGSYKKDFGDFLMTPPYRFEPQPRAGAITEGWSAGTVWPGNSNDDAHDIAVDADGNVYVTGYTTGLGTYWDYATIKYDRNGNELWVARYNGPGDGDDNANAIAVDNSGNVYVTGSSVGSDGNYDYATIKYGPDGKQVWVARYSDPANGSDHAYSISVDSVGNVYVTGASAGGGISQGYCKIKYDSNGNELWVSKYSGPADGWDGARTIAIDSRGDVYVTGYSKATGGDYDYATVKYGQNGNQLWTTKYNGSANGDDYANAVAVDGYGNVYVTGYTTGLGTGRDYATIKYNSNGNELWVVRYNKPGKGDDYANAIVVDGSGNVYVTGSSIGAGGDYDYATIKYGPNGKQQWVARYNGMSGGYVRSMPQR